MAFNLGNGIHETTTTTGTGAITLDGAVTNRLAFSTQYANTNKLIYTIFNDAPTPVVECGYGTYLTAGPSIQRDTVLYSTNGSDMKLNLGAGTHNVVVGWPGETLANLANPDLTNGIVVRSANPSTGQGPTFITRSIVQGGSYVTVTDGNGVAGPPTINDSLIDTNFARKNIAQTFAGTMTFTATPVFNAVTDHKLGLRMENNVAITGETTTPGVYRNLIYMTNGNKAAVGTVNAVTSLFTQGADTLTVDEGSGGKKIWHEANLIPFNDLVDGGPDYFESTPATLVIGTGNGGEAHGLANRPRLILGVLRCITANNGYAIGDEIPWTMGTDGAGSATRGPISWADTTNVNFICGNVLPFIPSATDGNGISLVASQWEFFIRAWR